MDLTQLPFSQACENNKQPILAILTDAFKHSKRVLEIGSGTGQHAEHFAPALKHLEWFTSDQPQHHQGIQARVASSSASNLHTPLSFTIGRDDWPVTVDAVFSANTIHIMQRDEAKLMVELIGRHLPVNGVFCLYGPFNINGQYTSQSNAAFDQSLRQRGCGGLLDLNKLLDWAESVGLVLEMRHQMPANNMLLQLRKIIERE